MMRKNRWVWIRESRKGHLKIAPYRRLMDRMAEILNVHGQTVTILWSDDEKIRQLKKQFLNVDEPTDVLAFPIRERLPNRTFYLGDIIISLDTAERQAREKGHSLEVEVAILTIHGFLHLLGYDHEVDDGEMEALESKLRKMLLKDFSGKMPVNGEVHDG